MRPTTFLVEPPPPISPRAKPSIFSANVPTPLVDSSSSTATVIPASPSTPRAWPTAMSPPTALSIPRHSCGSSARRQSQALRLLYRKMSLDKFLICDTITLVDNYVWSAAACSRFSFLGLQFQPLQVQNNQNRVL